MRYLADDGKIFDNKKECMEYEETLGTFLDANGDVCTVTSDIFFIHTDCYLSEYGLDKGNWAWDEGTGEWRDIDEYLNFLHGVAKRLKSGAR